VYDKLLSQASCVYAQEAFLFKTPQIHAIITLMNKDEAKKLADLARIEATDEELEKIASEMGSILEYVDKIKSADISDVSAESRAENASVRNIMVKDENPHAPGENTEKILAEAPATQDSMIKVKKILNNSDA
jgi:aspartyl-tRNA(Asn)/glutamyl-tRNA(Gln) amidotransferase subunit C